jgi:hypothetical protein
MSVQDWVVQADRGEWLKTAELRRGLRARLRETGRLLPHAMGTKPRGQWEEAVADRKAKRGAKMSHLARGMATPEGDLRPWTFLWKEWLVERRDKKRR